MLLHVQVLTGPDIFSSYATLQTWCNIPHKFMPMKIKQSQKVGDTDWLINSLIFRVNKLFCSCD